jgi:phage protein U
MPFISRVSTGYQGYIKQRKVISSPISAPATYSIVSGTKLPIYGTGAGTYPPTASWTGIQNASVDDNFLTISLPFTFYIAGTGYTTTYMGSNTYLTFSAGASEYGQLGALGATRPPVPKFHFGSADNSYQRVSRFASGTNYQRIRYEGTAATSGTVGAPNIVLEITLFNPSIMGGNNVLELLVGNHSRTTGARMVASSTTQYATYTLSTNQSYVFVGNSDGTSWTISTGFNVSY